jgi:hypothetical protein
VSRERELLQRVAVQLPVFDLKKASDLVDEIQELLAQPEQEPVAWQFRTFHGEHTVCPGWDVWEHCTEQKFNNVSEHVTKGFYQVRKLYTAPQKREPLSEEGRKSVMSEQQAEAWIIVNKETGYRTQVSDLTPFLYHREIFEVIPLYTAPPKREPLSEDKLDALAEANITDEGIAGYYLGFRDAEKAHGITGVDDE